MHVNINDNGVYVMHLLRKIIVGTMIAGGTMVLATVSHAESFSFTSTSKATNQISIPFPKRPGGSRWIAGKTNVVDSKRGKLTNTFVCSSMSNAPSDLFDLRVHCDVTEKEGETFGIYGGCNYVNTERSVFNCVGGLIGKAGAYKGRVGSITWNQNREGAASGAGVWNE